MKLEVLRAAPAQPGRGAPLLFVHGAFSAAWCWAEHFLPYFADRGYDCYAVSLRGHGASEGSDQIHAHSLRDYVDDVARVVDSMPVKPVLVGHSMGGMVIQHYLDHADVPAAVLMASVPPSGLFGPSVDLAWRDPSFFGQMGLIQYANPGFATVEGLRRVLFSRRADDAVVAKTFARMQPESQRAICDMTWPRLRLRRRRLPPLLVLGAEHDAFFRPHSVHATAGHLGVEAEIIPGMAHAMMLEPDWQRVADRIHRWLAEIGF